MKSLIIGIMLSASTLSFANQNCYISADGVVICSNGDGTWSKK